jgi:hypothetical protein
MERGKARLEKLRKRRKKAVALFEQGERQAAVALHLRVSRQSVSEWWQAWVRHEKLRDSSRCESYPGNCRSVLVAIVTMGRVTDTSELTRKESA